MDTNALVHALILIAEVLEEGGHDLFLVKWAGKVVRESAAREPRRNFWFVVHRSANGSDIGACGSVIMSLW
jgi:hypothetical protein